jgi:hypothetical protein
MVRCKFKCQKVTKQAGWNGHPFVYEAELGVVAGDSEENNKFFAATPGGRIHLTTLKLDTFDVGREYYVDITPAAGEAPGPVEPPDLAAAHRRVG